MGYLYLIGAVLAGAVKGYAGKICSLKIKGMKGSVYMNILRSALCCLMGAAIMLVRGTGVTVDGVTVAVSLFSGVMMSLFLLSWLLAIRGGAYVMMDICSSAGLIIPCVAGQFLFGEPVTLLQYAGIALLMAAIVILNGYSNQVAGKASSRQIMLMVMVCVGSGGGSLATKMYNAWAPHPDAMLFNVLTFLVSTAALGVTALVVLARSGAEERAEPFPLKKVALPLVVMAVMLFLNNVFKTWAAGMLPSVLMFPLMRGLAIIVASAMAVLFFKEPVTKRSVLGLSLAVAALIVINGI